MPTKENGDSKLKLELAQREAELEIINSIQQGLAANLDVQSIYDLVGDKIRDIFNAQVVMISPYDAQTNLIEHRYAIERGERVYSPGSHAPGGFRSEIIRTGKPVLVNTNVAQQASRLGQPTLPGTQTPKSWLGVPMIVHSQVAGVLSLQNLDYENAFEESDIRLLQTITSSMSVALENARLFGETQRLLRETSQRAIELQIINTVQEGLAKKLEMQAIYDLIGEKIRETLKEQAHTIFFAISEIAADFVIFPFFYQDIFKAKSWKPDMTLLKKLLKTNQTIIFRGETELKAAGIDFDGSGCALFVPLLASTEIKGIAGVINHQKEDALVDSDAHLLETLANSMSVALDNAQLWEKEKLYRKALEREFEIGREIQASFLPDTLPQPKGWTIAASLKSAREVAGDFYDVFELSDGTLGLVIADICDKGLGAALFMTLFRSLLRAISNMDFFTRTVSDNLISTEARLRNAISLTNNYIVETHGDTGMFATIFFGILDVKSGLLTYINAGHIPPLMINKAGIKASLKTLGPAVGAVVDTDYLTGQIPFEKDDILFAYTDGVSDTADPAGALFNVEGFLTPLVETQSLGSLLERFQQQNSNHAAGAKQFDDITMLAVKRMK